MAKYAYIRVSTKEQNTDRQYVNLDNLGIPEKNRFEDKQSGKDFDRPNYIEMKAGLKEGDVLYVHELDRLGRNKDMILQEWYDITKVIKADIIVLDMPLLDTTKFKGMSGLEHLVTDIVLQILSYLAEEERRKSKIRQREGINAARAAGKHLGRPTEPPPKNWDKIKADVLSGDIGATEAMKLAKISRTKFYALMKE